MWIKFELFTLQLQTECPKGENWRCDCEFSRLELLKDKLPTFAVSVDCSNRDLAQLPETLPRNTISLNVSYNNVIIQKFN